MKIEKEYNVQGLADKVKGCIKTVCETKSRNVSLDVITAQEIVGVLKNLIVKDLPLYVELVNTQKSVRY